MSLYLFTLHGWGPQAQGVAECMLGLGVTGQGCSHMIPGGREVQLVYVCAACWLGPRTLDLRVGGLGQKVGPLTGFLNGRFLAVLSQARPRAHRHGIRETQAPLSGKSVFNFWPGSGSRSQECWRGGGLQAAQPAWRPAWLCILGFQHPFSLAQEVKGAFSRAFLGRPGFHLLRVWAVGVPASLRPLTWEVGLGALGPTGLCESGCRRC